MRGTPAHPRDFASPLFIHSGEAPTPAFLFSQLDVLLSIVWFRRPD
jgi:hypothetical protein